jgi:hypothetical protein
MALDDDLMRLPDPDKRGELIAGFNDRRARLGQPPLTPRQEHLVREFSDDNGMIEDKELQPLRDLLASNSR